MKTGIVWFRNDLRVTDNEALSRAAAECDQVVPLYIFNSDQISRTDFASRKIGPRRIQFILESLTDLKMSLNSLGAELLVEFGSAREIIARLAKEFSVSTIYAQKESMREELDQESMMMEGMKPFGSSHFFHGHSLYHPDDIPFGIEKIPDVFTQFRKKCEKLGEIRPIVPIPKSLKSPKGITPESLPNLKDLGFDWEEIDEKAAITFRGGEREARKRLDRYFWESENLTKYKYTRNGLLGESYSSKFSAWLSQGCISPRMIYSEVKRFEREVAKNSSTYWLIFELIWRDYFRYVGMKFGNRLFHFKGITQDEIDIKPNDRMIDAWKKGETGIPFIDANMRELNETGFMSNRGRQNVASYFVKDLKQDWRMGAAYFEQELIDYDVTSNWGNWAYVAGVGNDPRENRYFNIISQANRYDEKGDYVKHWIPELAKLPAAFIHKPWELSDSDQSKYGIIGTPYSKPLLVSSKWT